MKGLDDMKRLSICRDEDVWEIDFSDMKIDRNLTKKASVKHRGSVRISEGLFYTKEEWEEKRKRILDKELP